MPVTANIAPNIESGHVQTRGFDFPIVFTLESSQTFDFDSFVIDADDSLSNLSVADTQSFPPADDPMSDPIVIGDFEVGGGTDRSVVISVSLPEGVRGSFVITLMGSVMVNSQQETIDSTAKTILYDTRTSIAVNSSDLIHQPDYSVDFPIMFDDDVSRLTRTDFDLVRVRGSEIFGMETFLTGRDRDFTFSMLPEIGTEGVLELNLTGAATRDVTDRILDVDLKPVLVPFNRKIPQIIEIEAEPLISEGTYDILWTLDHPDDGFDTDDILYSGDYSGIDFTDDDNRPSVYRARSLDVKPDIPPAPDDPDTVPTALGEWVLQQEGSARVPAVYILLRFNVPETATGQLIVSPKLDAFRPVIL